jgi:hypothetical protein
MAIDAGFREANLTALAALVTSPGHICRVTTVGRSYLSVPSGTSTADGYAYVTGNGVDWQYLQGSSDIKWKSQNAWYVSSTGNDENDGYTSGTALKTIDEVQRRWGLNPVLLQSTSIYLANGDYGTTQKTLQYSLSQPKQILEIVGTPSSALISDTVGTYTTQSFVTNRPYLITGNTITDWTPYVGKRIRFTVSGAISYVLLQNPFGLGNSTAEITQPILEPVSPYSIAVALPTEFTPTGGLAFVVENLPTIVGLTLIDNTSPTSLTDGSFNHWPSTVVKSVSVAHLAVQRNTQEALGVLVWGSQLYAVGTTLSSNSVHVWGCFITIMDYVTSSVSYYDCGFKTGIPSIYPYVATLGPAQFVRCVFEGIGLFITYTGVWLDQCGIFNSTGDGISTLGQAYELFLGDGIYGSGNVYGITIAKETKVFVHNGGSGQTKITGASGDLRISGIGTFSWASVPFNNKSGSSTTAIALVAGSVAISITNLPTDAQVSAWYTTNTDPQGILRITSQTTSGFTITSTCSSDTNSVEWSWISPSGTGAGVYSV